VTQAEGALQQALITLEGATLKAPFGGTVSAVSIVTGTLTGGGVAAVKMINRNPLHVDFKLSEIDVAQVKIGQPVQVTITIAWGMDDDGGAATSPRRQITAAASSLTRCASVFPGNDPIVRLA